MGVLIRPLLLVLVGFALVACAAGSDGSRLLESKLENKRSPDSKRARLEQFVANADRDATAGIVKYGTDRVTGPGIGDGFTEEQDEGGDIQLNLVDVPVAVAAKSVLGDILELNYTVDVRVQGTVTVQTSKPVSAAGMLRIFEGALRGVGAAIVGDGASYRIVPLEEAPRSGTPVQTAKGSRDSIGQRPEVVTLRYVSADNIREVIEPLIPAGMLVKVDSSRNVIILTGTASEIAAIRETISIFDVDWMRGMSFGLVAVKSSDPGAIVSDLEQIYDTRRGPLRNVVRFVPNRRLKSVLIISSRSKYLKEATQWIRKLDALAADNEQSLHVYRVQNRTAAELAKVLQSILRSESSGQAVTVAGGSGEVAPKLDEQQVASNAPGADPITGPKRR
ncbi:MAG: hypothetical protein HC869_27370 [Rhodospirillales bacterium]|nr:hypothetical protein [Rhodospirillales bacterium]